MTAPINEKGPAEARHSWGAGLINTCHTPDQIASINLRLSQTRHRLDKLLAVWTATALFMAAAGIVLGGSL